jgi:hypothetical protein
VTVFTTEKSLTTPAKLSCALASDRTVYKVGELPKFTVNIFNNSKDEIYLIGSLDGSAVKWRFPYCYYTIDRPKPDTTRLQRCGNMNTLRVADFKLVKAEQKFNPYESIDGHGFFTDYTTTNHETFKNPGVYKIKFHYSTNSQNISDFTGDRPFRSDRLDSLTINTFFKKVPKVEITSNEIEIRVEE